jgi:antitoxin PrlF
VAIAQSKLTAQGQISVPAKVRRTLGVGPGSVLEWDQDGENILVRRVGQYSSEDIQSALFPEGRPETRTVAEMRERIRRRTKARHARS